MAVALLAQLSIGVCGCLLICANPNDPGLLGTMNRFVFTTIPNVFTYESINED